MMSWVSIGSSPLGGWSGRHQAAGIVQSVGGVQKQDARGAAVAGTADVEAVAHGPFTHVRLETDLLHAQRADVREPVRIPLEGRARPQDRARDMVAAGPGVVPVRDRDAAEPRVREGGGVAARPDAVEAADRERLVGVDGGPGAESG